MSLTQYIAEPEQALNPRSLAALFAFLTLNLCCLSELGLSFSGPGSLFWVLDKMCVQSPPKYSVCCAAFNAAWRPRSWAQGLDHFPGTGYKGTKPYVILRLEQQEAPWICEAACSGCHCRGKCDKSSKRCTMEGWHLWNFIQGPAVKSLRALEVAGDIFLRTSTFLIILRPPWIPLPCVLASSPFLQNPWSFLLSVHLLFHIQAFLQISFCD